MIDLSEEGLAEGVRRLTDGYGADVVVDAIGGQILSEALEILAPDGNLTTLGYAASRETTIDVTDLIWKRAGIRSFSLFHQPLSPGPRHGRRSPSFSLRDGSSPRRQDVPA